MSGSTIVGCDYTCQRKNNIEKLKTLYTNELSKYNGAYNDWLTKKAQSENPGDDEEVLKAQSDVETINQTLNSILFELKKNIEYTDGLIANQKRVIELKNAQVIQQNRQAAMQEKGVMNKNNELISKANQIEFSKKRNNFRKFILLILIILNIILGAIFYKVVLKK